MVRNSAEIEETLLMVRKFFQNCRNASNSSKIALYVKFTLKLTLQMYQSTQIPEFDQQFNLSHIFRVLLLNFSDIL